MSAKSKGLDLAHGLPGIRGLQNGRGVELLLLRRGLVAGCDDFVDHLHILEGVAGRVRDVVQGRGDHHDVRLHRLAVLGGHRVDVQVGGLADVIQKGNQHVDIRVDPLMTLLTT